MSDEARQAATAQLLSKLAETLNVPVETFYDAPQTDARIDPGSVAARDQNAEMTRLFASLRDHQSRALSIAYVRALLDAETRDGER